MKRLLAILLVLAMLPIPAAFACKTETESFSSADYAAVDAMWQALEQAEQNAMETRPTRQRADESTAMAVARAAQEHPLYEEGTLRWNGDGQFTFETTVGMTCGYSVRLRNLASQEAQTQTGTELPIVDGTPSDSSRNVYVIQPYYGLDESFTQQYQQEGKDIAAAMGGTCTVYTQKEATVDVVADAIEQGTVVIFDSHGETDFYDDETEDCTSGATTSYLLLQTGNGLTEKDYADDNGTYHAVYYGRDYLNSKIHYYAVDGTCIANHMDEPAQDSLLWMAICLSMATDGLHAPLMEKGVDVAYGYSQAVTFGGDYCWEDCFWTEMRKGAAVWEAAAKMKEVYGCWDYSPQIYAANGWWEDEWMCETVEEAQRTMAAFPVVVSAQDAYPGHGNVDDYQEVLSTWKLPRGEYLLTASSNDESLGLVTVTGNVAEALPEAHVFVESYSLSPADAAVVNWEENIFTVTQMTADCHLTVNFAKVPETVISYIVPEGCTKETFYGYVGEEVLLSAPEGTPVADGEAYEFLGWTQQEITDSPEKPEYFTESFVPTETENTLYALYTYEDRTGVCYTTSLRMKVCYAALYEDVDLDAWYHEALDFVLEEGYMNGTGENCFEPNGKLTRAMLATILYRMSGDTQIHSHPFQDVPQGQWYSDAIAWAYETGVVTGTGETTFDPDGFVTREQAAAMFYRYAKMAGQSPEATGNLGSFADASKISDYAKLPLRWAVGEGIINGKGNNILDPTGTATRAEIAKIIYFWIG